MHFLSSSNGLFGSGEAEWCSDKIREKSTKQSIVFYSFSPKGLFRIKGDSGHSFPIQGGRKRRVRLLMRMEPGKGQDPARHSL